MPLIARMEPNEPMTFDVIGALEDSTPEQQLALICAEMAKPVKPETVRRKFMQYWPIVRPWALDRPEFFDAVIYQFAAELEARHASAPDGIRHLREIAES